jgi:hypothetical protein
VKLISIEFRSHGGRGGDGSTKYTHDFLLTCNSRIIQRVGASVP